MADCCSVVLFLCYFLCVHSELIRALTPNCQFFPPQIQGKIAEAVEESVVPIYLASAFIFLLLAAAVAISPFFFNSQLGWFETVKQYLDEAADLCSIFFFVCMLAVCRTVQFFFDGLISDAKFASANAGARSVVEAMVDGAVQRSSIVLTSCCSLACLVTVPLIASLSFTDNTAVHFFKNNMDEVADVSSILSVALFLHFRARVRAFDAQYFDCVETGKKR